MLRALLKSNSLRAAAVLGLGGLAFTLGNLILARTLAPAEYGLVSLVLGIVAVAGLAAPLGLDLVVGRRGLPLNGRLRGAILSIATAVGLVAAVASALIYRLDFALAASIAVATVASGLMQAGAAHFQGQQRFGPATWIVQSSNWTVLLAAVLTAVLGLDTAAGSCVLLALTTAVGGGFAWLLAARAVATQARRSSTVTATSAGPAAPDVQLSSRPLQGRLAGTAPLSGALLREALSLVSIHVANSVFLQLERLLLAPVAGVHALALFGVVAALVASPFRMLQMAVLYTLIPSLRGAKGVDERRRLLRRETLLVAVVIGVGSIVIWYVSPPLAHWFLAGRYDLSAALLCAALVSGTLKLCSAFATGTVIALSEEKGLRHLGLMSWATIGLSVVAGFAAAPWGLVGVLYGISSGWLLRSVIAAWMAMPHLRRPAALLPGARFADRTQMPRARR
jgi:O-antigen/teichoic acid export membrane protein